MSQKTVRVFLPALLVLSVTFIAAVGSFYYWVAYTLASNDTAWLMRAGQYIIGGGRLPAHDIFSWTCHDRPWLLYQWLFEVVVGAIFNAAGGRGLWLSALTTGVTAGLLYFYLLPRQWLRLRLPLLCAFPFLAFALSPPWFFVRPQLVSQLFVALFINACERFRRTGSARSLWYLPVLTAIWANCHPLWSVGLLVVGAYVAWHLARHWRDREWKSLFQPVLVFAVCLSAVLVNPYGARLFSYEWYLSSAGNFKLVHELTPLLVNPPVPFYPFLVFLAVSSAMLIWRFRFVPAPGLLLSAFGILSALAMNKFAPICATLVWPYLGHALASLRGVRSHSFEPQQAHAGPEKFWQMCIQATRPVEHYLFKKGGIRAALVAILISAACFEMRIPTSDYAIIVFAYNDIETMRYLATHRVSPCRIFNDEPTGSLMIFFNILPVFCDGRVDFYGREFCGRWLSCIDGDRGWQEYLNEFGVNEIVIRDTTGLFSELVQSRDWLRAFDNGTRSIWLRNDKPGQLTVKQWHAEAQNMNSAR